MEVSPARKGYTAEKEALEREVLDMLGRAESMFAKSVEALADLDRRVAYEVLSMDDAIDVMDLQIEERCLKILALQQPMASDLREIGTVLKMLTDIERIGDLAVDIAKVSLKIEKELGHSDYIDLRKMAGFASQMLLEVVGAFVRRDVSRMAEVEALEREVDRQYRELRGQVHAYMRSNPEEVVAASWMLLAVHHIERVADHAVNMAERIGFMVTGTLRQLAHEGDKAPARG